VPEMPSQQPRPSQSIGRITIYSAGAPPRGGGSADANLGPQPGQGDHHEPVDGRL
jgi:hypothetical protein